MADLTDKNTAYIYIGDVSTELIEQRVQELTDKALELVSSDLPGFCTNIPISKEGKRQPICYVWWDDSVVLDCIFENWKKTSIEYDGKVYSLEICRYELTLYEGVSTNVITTSWALPDWITEADLIHIFSRFNVSNYFSCKIVKKRVNRKLGRYPFITFHKSSYDALFALALKKVVHVRKGSESATLIFYPERI